MKIINIINDLEKNGTWVNYNKSRDYVLHGDPNQEVIKIGVCWMATNKAIKIAIKSGINFIISHENPFYLASTSPDKIYVASANEKRKLLDTNNICVYRCHDFWDRLPDIGVTDIWAKIIGIDHTTRNINSFVSFGELKTCQVKDIALKIVDALTPYGQDSVQIFGDSNKIINSIAIGTGAATNVPDLVTNNPGVIIVSDDGCMTYTGIQYCLDNDIPVIRVNHAQCEMPGIKTMVEYFHKKYNIEVKYLDEGYQATTITK